MVDADWLFDQLQRGYDSWGCLKGILNKEESNRISVDSYRLLVQRYMCTEQAGIETIYTQMCTFISLQLVLDCTLYRLTRRTFKESPPHVIPGIKTTM